MRFPSQFSRPLFAGVIALSGLLAGCAKKPLRPDPTATAYNGSGAQPGYTGDSLNPGGSDNLGAYDSGLTDDPNSMLATRGVGGVIETADRIEGLLLPVYFGFNQSAISAAERSKLQDAQAYLVANPAHRLLLEGNCDWRGTTEYNQGLGDRRAAAAKEYLVTLGVDAKRIEVVSKGDLDAVENANEAQMALDRRVAQVILKK